MNYYTLQINSGNSVGPYNVYYNTISSGTISYLYPSGAQATGLTISQLQNGVVVYSPNDNVQSIFLYNVKCDTYQEITVSTTTTTSYFPCFCVTILFEQNYNLTFCPTGNIVNGKPQYQTSDGLVMEWQTTGTGYWEILNFTVAGVIFRSIDNDNTPDSNWYAVGNNSSLFQISAKIGDCSTSEPSSLTLRSQDPSCEAANDGTIFATAIGGAGGWTYSLDGLVYNNVVGVFNNLIAGQYTVYAKDLNNTVISQTITLTSNLGIIFTLPSTYNVTQLIPNGNMKYYNVNVVYNTSFIPVGTSVTFDYNILYSMKYNEPGQVLFDTSIHYLIKNGSNLPVTFVQSTPLSLLGPSNLACLTYGDFRGSDEYQSTNITLTNGDTFETNIIYGIDTNTDGNIDGSCITSAFVNLTLGLENIELDCTCCNINRTTLSVAGQPQFYNL